MIMGNLFARKFSFPARHAPYYAACGLASELSEGDTEATMKPAS